MWDSMDSSTFTTLADFEKYILWSQVNGDIPRPPWKATSIMIEAVNTLFYDEDGIRREDVSENEIANTIVKDVINKIALPGKLRAALSQNSHCATDRTKSKVNAALYPRLVLPKDDRPDWTHLRLFIEFKQGGAANDPFDDKSDHPEAWAQSRQDVREQLLAYASTTFQYQHRTALFSLLINGDEFRGMYWDRSGLIATNAINYLENPGSLLQFLWAFASMSDERQGIDPTATLLVEGSDDYTLMDAWAVDNPALDMPFQELADVSEFPDSDALPPPGPAGNTRQKTSQPSQPLFKYVREDFQKSLCKGWPRYKLLVGEDKHEFLVACPVFEATSMFGRGTRGYIACDVKNNKFVWLKDSWRPFYEGVEPEGKYLETMRSKPGVKLTVPTVVAHGDVLQQTTYVAEYMTDEQMRPVMPPTESVSGESTHGKKGAMEEEEAAEPESVPQARLLIHYRLAVQEICLKMGEFTSGEQLVRLILDCIVTHHDAYAHFRLLHCDISTGNILIMPQVEMCDGGRRRVMWQGCLTDWELAKYIPKDTALQRARQPERTGTWQFMSVQYTTHPERPVNVPDELESFFHVLLHHSVRYLRHTWADCVPSFITDYFNTFRLHEKSVTQTCSAAKASAIFHGELCVGMTDLQFLNEDNAPKHPLNELLRMWLRLFVARYRILRKQDRYLREADPTHGTSHVQERADDLDGDVPQDGKNYIRAKLSNLRQRMRGGDEYVEELSESDEEEDADGTTTKAENPSWDLTKKRAAQLDTHLITTEIFSRYLLRSDDWPADRVGDQLSESYNPKKQIVAMKSTAMSNIASGRASALSNKARTEPSAAAAPSGSGPTTAATGQATRAQKNPTRRKRRGIPRPTTARW